MKKIGKEDFKELIRISVLNALDETMTNFVNSDSAGAKDEDLPVLFKSLDQHAETLWERYIKTL